MYHLQERSISTAIRYGVLEYSKIIATRQCKNKIDFEKKARQFYQDRALARALSG